MSVVRRRPPVLAGGMNGAAKAHSRSVISLALVHLGRSDEAVAAYRKALVLVPDYAVAMFNMAGARWNLGDREEGGRIFRTAVRQFPDHELSAKARQDLPGLF